MIRKPFANFYLENLFDFYWADGLMILKILIGIFFV